MSLLANTSAKTLFMTTFYSGYIPPDIISDAVADL